MSVECLRIPSRDGQSENLKHTVWSILHFRSFLKNALYFEVRTDHESLKCLWKVNDNQRITRWCLALEEYNFSIKYRADKYQQHVDIFIRDVHPDADEEEILEKISLPRDFNKTSCVHNVHVSDKRDNSQDALKHFPTTEQLRQAVGVELQDSSIECKKPRVIDGISVNKHDKINVPRAYRMNLMNAYHYTSFGGHVA